MIYGQTRSPTRNLTSGANVIIVWAPNAVLQFVRPIDAFAANQDNAITTDNTGTGTVTTEDIP